MRRVRCDADFLRAFVHMGLERMDWGKRWGVFDVSSANVEASFEEVANWLARE